MASDFATALVLVGVAHADEARRAERALLRGSGGGGGSDAAAAAMEAGGFGNSEDDDGDEAGGSGADDDGDPLRAPPPHPPHRLHPRGAGGGSGGVGGAPLSPRGRPLDPELVLCVAEAAHFASHALAPCAFFGQMCVCFTLLTRTLSPCLADGWPLYLWAHPAFGTCDLCCGACGSCIDEAPRAAEDAARSGGTTRGGARQPTRAAASASAARARAPCCALASCCGGSHPLADALDVAAMLRFSGVAPPDVVSASFRNAVLGSLPHCILRDPASRSIVLAIRGAARAEQSSN